MIPIIGGNCQSVKYFWLKIHNSQNFSLSIHNFIRVRCTRTEGSRYDRIEVGHFLFDQNVERNAYIVLFSESNEKKDEKIGDPLRCDLLARLMEYDN